MSSFRDKNILITGGAGEIGTLMCKEALQRNAAKVIIWDINEEGIQEVTRQLSSFSDRIFTYRIDLSRSSQIYETSKKVLDSHGYIDILFNNAGIVVGKDFRNHTQTDIEQTIRINLLGAMHTTNVLLPEMLERSSAHIINIASAAGLIANPKMSVYAGSKWGMIGWSESLRLELKQTPVNVTTVETSYIKTGMFKGVSAPFLTPLLEPETIVHKIMRAVEKNNILLRAPFMVKILPILKGILPTRVFDFVAGRLFRVYHSMDSFKGRTQE